MPVFGGWILFPAFLFTTATVLLRASARATGNHRKVWLCFGLAFLVYGSGELIWAIYDVFGANPDPFPVPAYGFYFPFSLLMIAGFWQSAHRAPSMGVTVVQLANLGILFTSILIAYLFLFYDLMDAPVPPIVPYEPPDEPPPAPDSEWSRSKPRVVRATFQPSPTPPRFSPATAVSSPAMTESFLTKSWSEATRLLRCSVETS